jgi:hypothetical protein
MIVHFVLGLDRQLRPGFLECWDHRRAPFPEESHGGHGGFLWVITTVTPAIERGEIGCPFQILRVLRESFCPLFSQRHLRFLRRTNDFLTFELADQVENRKASTPGDVRVFANLP